VDGTVSVSGTVTVAGAVTNAGTFAVQVDGSALTALQLLDNVVYAEDAAHSSGDSGTFILAVRRDANTTFASTDGDYTPLSVDSSGNLKVAIISGAGSGGTALADGATFTADTTSLTPIGGYRDDASTATVTEGDAAAARITEYRAIHVNLRDASGAEVSVGGGTQYTEDAAAAANPVGTALNLIRADALAGVTTTDGDNVAARGTDKGELYVKHADALTVNSHAVTNAGTFAVQSGAERAEDAAHSTGHTGMFVLAVRADTATSTAGTDGDYSALVTDTNGRLHVLDQYSLQILNSVQASADAVYAEDDAHLSAAPGVFCLTVRTDTAAARAGTDGDYQPFITDASGRLHVNVGNTVTVASHAVTNAGTFATQAAQSGTWTVQPGNTANTTPWLTSATPATSGGLSIFRSIDLDETEEEVKATAGQVYGAWVTNTATATRWIKFYNLTAANTNVGSSTPLITVGMPGNTSDDISAMFGSAHGITFDTAISVAATTAAADADTGAPAAGDVIINVFFK
jgi:hypothetical protein